MSSLGKILLYVAVAGAVAAAGGAYMLFKQNHDTAADLVQVKQSVEAVKKKEVEAEKAKDVALKEKEATDSALTEANTNLDDMKSKLDAATKAQDDIKAALATAAANADKATQDLKHFQDILGGMSPEEAKAAIAKAQADKTAAETEQKILADQVQATTKQIADLKEAINKGPDKMPPGISGKITVVNRAWNFVVLNVGLSSGLIPKGELIVYRGDRFLGKIKVTSVEENTAVADIEPDAKGDIQAGDSVLN
jgi:hypothetical protein